jgi:hypothetical protein
MDSSDQGSNSNAIPVVSHNVPDQVTRPFLTACFSDNLEEAVAFLDNEEKTPETLQMCLAIACRNNSSKIADYLLNNGAKLDSRAEFLACWRDKSIALFEVLIKHGWDINGPLGVLT